MKKSLFILMIFIPILTACGQTSKAKELFSQASEIFQNANITEWMEDSLEKETAIQKLDAAIEISPKWWLPYREKIQILKIGFCEKNAEQVNDVYNRWIKNGNTLNGFSKFSYACSLYCIDKKSQAMEIFYELYSKYSKVPVATDEEKIMFIFSGIITGEITETNIHSSLTDIFDEPMMQNIEYFLHSFKQSGKEILWTYI